MSCPICMNNYTGTTRKPVTCQYCPAAACRGCQQQYLLSSTEDPHCFSCKRGWSSEFMAANFRLTFHNGTLRKHRQKILLEREKSMLPAMQVFVEAKKNMDRLKPLVDEANMTYVEASNNMRKMRNEQYEKQYRYSDIKLRVEQNLHITPEEGVEYNELRNYMKSANRNIEKFNEDIMRHVTKALHTLNIQHSHWWRIYNYGEGADAATSERTKREFLMRCPAEGCRGFLSTAYNCGICEKKTCSDCLEILTEGGAEQTHTCKPENVESAKAIKKETRPCPKCGARIFKLEGCDQMYCTVESCHTAFSWNTGHIVSGRIHNPHYYEWLRRTGGGEAPREAGDIPCGGIPVAWAFTRNILNNTSLDTASKNRLLAIHRSVADLEARLIAYPTRRDQLANKEYDVDYLMNKLTDIEWQRKLEHAEARFNRKKEIGQVLQTVVTAAADSLQAIMGLVPEVQSLSTWSSITEIIKNTHMVNLEALRVYANDTYKKLGDSLHMAVPQILDTWEFAPVRALYKKEKKSSSKKGEVAPAEVVNDSESIPSLIEDEDEDEDEDEHQPVLNEII